MGQDSEDRQNKEGNKYPENKKAGEIMDNWDMTLKKGLKKVCV